MFELEQAIADWRDALIDGGTINSDEKQELESHLRESTVTLSEKGLSDQEAFWIAANRLGHPTKLQNEFVKNNSAGRWRYRFFWMLAGYLGFIALGGTVEVLTTMMSTAMALGGFAASATGVSVIALSLLLWGCIFAIAFRKRQCLGEGGESLPLSWIIAIGAMLVLGPAVYICGQCAKARFVEPAWFGEAAVYSTVGGFAVNLVFAVFCFAALWKLNDRGVLTTD
jgi:hypothetical protein